jgi:hypothetical protein
LASSGLLLNSCGPSDSSNEGFKTALKKSRKPAYAAQVKTDSALRLAQGEIYDTSVDSVSGDVGLILFNLSMMPAVDKSNIQSVAEQKIVQYEKMLGVKLQELTASIQELKKPEFEIQVVTFSRHYDDLLVRDAYIQAYFLRNPEGTYQLREIVNRSFGEITSVAGEVPSLNTVTIAAETGLQALLIEKEVPHIAVSIVDGKYAFSYAKTYKVKDTARDEAFALTFSGSELIEAFSFNQSVDHKFTAKVHDRSYIFNQMITKPLALVEVQNTVDAPVTTDLNGIGQFGTLAPAMIVQLSLGSATSRATIGDLAVTPAPNVAVASYQFPVEQGTSELEPLKNQMPAFMAYLSVHEVMTFVRKFLTDQQVPQLAASMTAVVNQPEACNAFWNGSFVTLFAEGTAGNITCTNTALIADIIYHEVGHGIDQFTGPQDPVNGGITDGAFSEGLGDIISSYITGSPNLAPGFILNDSAPLRTTLSAKVYPAGLVNEVHADGEIISAAFWKLRENYIKRYGAKAGARMAAQALFDHMLTTGSYVDSYAAITRLDDVAFDDGNPATPSKNFCVVNESFAVHGLATAANCQDANVLFYDPSLKLAIRANDGQGTLGFWASSKGAAKVVLCRGGRDACRTSQTEDVAFKKVRVADDGIDIYKSEATLTVQKDEELTLLSFNDAGALIGTSTAVFQGGQLTAP